MKKRAMLFDVIRLLLSVLLAAGCQTLFHACTHEDGTFGTCHYAQQTITMLGCVMVVWALLSLVISNDGMRRGLALAGACLSLAALIIPGIVIPLCMMSSMRCNSIMLPSVRLTAGLLMILSLAEVFVIGREEKNR